MHDLNEGGAGAGVCLGLQLLGAAGRGRHGRAALAGRRGGAVGHAGAQPPLRSKQTFRAMLITHFCITAVRRVVLLQVTCGSAMRTPLVMPMHSPLRRICAKQ